MGAMGFLYAEIFQSFILEHSSGQAPQHHMTSISCWENSIKMALDVSD